MLKTLNIFILILLSSVCYSQNVNWQNQPFRYRYKMLKIDSALVLSRVTSLNAGFDNQDSVGLIRYFNTDNLPYVKTNTGDKSIILNGNNASVVNLSSTGSFSLGQVTVTGTTTLTDAQTTVWVNNSALTTINLPTAVGRAGRVFIIKKTSAAAFAVTIDPAGAETIDGGSTIALSTQYAFIVIQTDGANWFQISPAL